MNQSQEKRGALKVAVLSSASGGGAGIAARRVTDALNLSQDVRADFIDMVALGGRVPSDAAPPGNMSNRRITDTHFTVEFPGYVRGWIVDFLSRYDVLNIHWASFLLSLGEIYELSRLGQPILFTCHDYYYFTGGCHYPATCDKLARHCIGCPQVDRNFCSTTVIAQNLQLKKKILSHSNVYLSAPSAFLVDEAVRARMVPEKRTCVLRNPYFPVRGMDWQSKSGRPRIALLADSMSEKRKAMPLAIESLALACKLMKEGNDDTEPFIVEIIGSADGAFRDAVERAGFRYRFHGRISEHKKIASILSQCHFLLTCSLEDNWPNVLVEAGSYGVLPIAGPGHGCEEFIRVLRAGMVARDYTPESFGSAIVDCIHEQDRTQVYKFGMACRSMHEPTRIGAAFEAVLFRICGAVERLSNESKGPELILDPL